jgi:hypothetical protein
MSKKFSHLTDVQKQVFNIIDNCIKYKAKEIVTFLTNNMFGDIKITINENDLKDILNGNFIVSFNQDYDKFIMILGIKKNNDLEYLNSDTSKAYEPEETICKINVGEYIMHLLKNKYNLTKSIKIKNVSLVQRSHVFTLTRKLI